MKRELEPYQMIERSIIKKYRKELWTEGEVYETIEDIWPDYPSKEDFLFNEDEY